MTDETPTIERRDPPESRTGVPGSPVYQAFGEAVVDAKGDWVRYGPVTQTQGGYLRELFKRPPRYMRELLNGTPVRTRCVTEDGKHYVYARVVE